LRETGKGDKKKGGGGEGEDAGRRGAGKSHGSQPAAPGLGAGVEKISTRTGGGPGGTLIKRGE